ncbi:MAG: amidohydrolase family protein, partial [Rubricella sp.]
LADRGIAPLEDAWRLISSGPAAVLGLDDRGRIAPGLRADLCIIEAETRRIEAVIAGGRIAFLRGEAAMRFLG